jgi:uncharacterized protein YcfL
MKVLILLMAAFAICLAGCGEDSRVNMRKDVASDTLVDNYVTRPVAASFSWLLGEGIVLNSATCEKNDSGFLVLHVDGFNKSYGTVRFQYRVEWLDAKGALIDTKTSVWLPMSAMSRQPFSFNVVAPRTEAVNFRIDTRKWE